MPEKKTVHRSSESGQFVTREEAEVNPATTEKESITGNRRELERLRAENAELRAKIRELADKA